MVRHEVDGKVILPPMSRLVFPFQRYLYYLIWKCSFSRFFVAEDVVKMSCRPEGRSIDNDGQHDRRSKQANANCCRSLASRTKIWLEGRRKSTFKKNLFLKYNARRLIGSLSKYTFPCRLLDLFAFKFFRFMITMYKPFHFRLWSSLLVWPKSATTFLRLQNYKRHIW